MPTMIGRRNVKGTIESVSVVQDETGYEVETYADHGTEWVAIEPLRASEVIQGQQVFGVTSAMLKMRFRSDVTERMRFVTDEGVTWDFLAPPIDPDGTRKELEILVGKSD